MHVFARRCIQISQAETYRESPQEKVSTSKWLFHSNNLHLHDLSTKTEEILGREGGGRLGVEQLQEEKVPISFPIEPRVPLPFKTGDRGELSLAAFRSPGSSAQRSKHRESPWKRASLSPAEDSRL